jgi:zinc finger HIT domain-containing protein 1
MPIIEVLPQTNPSHVAPGWAYVLESAAPDPSRALAPRVTGRRTAARSAIDAITGAHTKNQAAKVRTRLDELARDNPGKAEIDVPSALTKEMNEGRWKITKGAGKAVGAGLAGIGKQTTNVKKVLLSAKTWAHHAADEEVRVQNMAENHRSTRKDEPFKEVLQENSAAVSIEERELLATRLPLPPTEQAIETLLKAPPLSYGAAVAGPPLSSAPSRKFCGMCGYWGKVKCAVCGTYVCGLACKVTHDATEHPHR